MEELFGRFYKKVWPFLTRKRDKFMRRYREITRKFGRHVLTDRKVWPSFEGAKILDVRKEIWIKEK
jgi:hypothetical protein